MPTNLKDRQILVQFVLRNVDAVAIPDDGSGEQWKFALAPLRKGVPTFCDKPLAMTAKQAKEVAAVARRAERRLVSLVRQEPAAGRPVLLAYLNRLSDLLFALARRILCKLIVAVM